jgi:hypothetical protein
VKPGEIFRRADIVVAMTEYFASAPLGGCGQQLPIFQVAGTRGPLRDDGEYICGRIAGDSQKLENLDAHPNMSLEEKCIFDRR